MVIRGKPGGFASADDDVWPARMGELANAPTAALKALTC